VPILHVQVFIYIHFNAQRLEQHFGGTTHNDDREQYNDHGGRHHFVLVAMYDGKLSGTSVRHGPS
jgi:hypothetical protein